MNGNDIDDFGRRALNEYRRLASQIHEAQLVLKTLQPKLDKLAPVIQAYGLEAELDKAEPGDDARANTDIAKSKGELISAETEKYLISAGNHWTRGSEIYWHLVGKGVSIGGKNPNATLSAHLSNSKRFESDRARGWRMKQAIFEELTKTGAIKTE